MTGNDYVRLCPACGTAAAADAAQCAVCGTLLLGVDLTLKQAAATLPTAPAAGESPPPATRRCPHADCGAENPPGNERCLYCDRPFAVPPPPTCAGAAPATAMFRLPAALSEKFRIEEVLPAAGSEAEIMVLAGIASGVKVIAKLYRPGLLPKSEVLERVSQAAFRHVVRLIAWGESEGIGYEVMEYCPEGSLRRLMTAGPLAGDRLRAILVELAEALVALHELKVIHRDLKPENVLVRRRDPLDLVLTDFGIASIGDATQIFTSLARTLKYSAPETLSGVLDHAADFWSLGMVMAELVAGRHPFDGLSDAVIAHQLVTGQVDLSPIEDLSWQKLCRGLLLRDPQRRWGGAEIRRWLDGDPSLAMPHEELPRTQPVARPYRLGDNVCHNARELAVGLALHWPEGCKDLARGQLSAWVRDSLQEDNLLRFLQDLIDARDLSDDLRLMRLIFHIVPDMPPVWRGASLAAANLLALAARAEQGEGSAAEWLVSVFAQRVLRELPAERFPAEHALADGWEAAYDRFAQLWRDKETARTEWLNQHTRRAGVTDFDALVFGQPQTIDQPPAARLLPRLLLASGDGDYASRLRDRLRAEAAPLLADSPWLDALLENDAGVPDASELVVAWFLLPLARVAAEEVRRQRKRLEQAETAQIAALGVRTNHALAMLRGASELRLFADAAERLAASTAAHSLLSLIEEVRGLGLDDRSPLLRTLKRAEPLVLRIQERLDAWEHAVRINALLRNRNLGQGILLGIPGLLFFFGFAFLRLLPWLLLSLVAVAGWRLWVLKEIRDAIRSLAHGLPQRVPAATPLP